MKKNDIATLIFIVTISFMIAWFAANAIVPEDSEKSTKISVVDLISPDIESPDKRIFNQDAINPTIDRNIGKSADKLPLSDGGN